MPDPLPDQRPQSDEHAPHQQHYIDLVTGPVLDALRRQRGEIEELLLAIPEDRAGHRYEAGKWTIREVAGHLSDTERVYGYRALALARGDAAPLPKFDPDGYVAAAGFGTRSMASLVTEFLAVRDSTIRFFESLPSEAWSRKGTLGVNPLSVRALAFIAVGHVEQHRHVLHERYGVPR